MRLFLDTANLDEVRQGVQLGVIDGVTTNPSLVAKEKCKFKERVIELCELVDGPVSAEVIATDSAGIIREARELSEWHEWVVVKVPLTPEGIVAVKQLSNDGIRTNVTLCFSVNQALLAAKAGATYISPFVGRLDDIGHNGIELVQEIVKVYSHYGFETQVLAASLRHTLHVKQSALAGAHVATIPFKVFMQMFKHPLTDIGLENFLNDWNKVKDIVT